MSKAVLRIVRSALGCLALLTACSLFVEQEIKNVRCRDTGRIGPPACDSGQICGQGRCHVCETRELCGDGFDNDCNGLVEEGCGVWSSTGGAGGETNAPHFGGVHATSHSGGQDDGGSGAGGGAGVSEPFP